MKKMLQLFYQVTRARTLPMMVAPVVIGALFAWSQNGLFHWGLFGLALVGALSAHLAANVTNDIFDFAEGTDQAAQALVEDGTTFVTGSRALMQKKLSLKGYRLVTLACFALALVCGLVLTVYRPWTLAFAIAGFLLAFFYVAPPLRLAYVGHGAGELNILLSFGILPLVGSYYIQSGTINWTAVLAALPIGLYTTLVLYFHHFLHWRADQAIGKMTPIVVLGEYKARIVGGLFLVLIALTIILDIWLQVYPWYSIVVVFTTIPVTFALLKATGNLKDYMKLMATTTSADLQTAFLLIVAILINGILHI